MRNEAYSALKVARITRTTLRQLQYWDEQGILSAHQEDGWRRYTRSKVILAFAISELKRMGLSLGLLRLHVARIGEMCRGFEAYPKYCFLVAEKITSCLSPAAVANGDIVGKLSILDQESLIKFVSGRDGALFVVDLSTVFAEEG